jgi:hypothetical protein
MASSGTQITIVDGTAVYLYSLTPLAGYDNHGARGLAPYPANPDTFLREPHLRCAPKEAVRSTA